MPAALISGLLLANLLLPCPHAQAREASHRFDIPAGPLSGAVARLSQVAGLSIGSAGDLSRVMTRGVKGMMTADVALGRILQGTGWRAVRLGPGLYKIEKAPPAKPRAVVAPASSPGAAPTPPAIGADIIVTGQKRPQPLATVPLSLSVLPMDSFSAGSRSPTSRDITLRMEGLAMTNLGPGQNRQFIRGVADSPFNGQSQSTVAVQLDDARITFNAPDPDLRLVDVERVEILKGPQGPLYGSGALGGIYHVVTRRPDLTETSGAARLSVEGVQHGDIGTGAEAVVNLPLAEDRLAIRAVGYRIVNAGWIDNEGGRQDSNSAETSGLRIAVRWRPLDRVTIDAGYIMQDINSRDSQYVLTSDDTLKRTVNGREPTDNDFKLAHGSIRVDLGDMELLSATSYVDHGFDYALDASAAAAQFALPAPLRFEDERTYSLFNQEVRLASTGPGHWVVGASYLNATTHGISTMTDASALVTEVERLDRRVVEYALFGEATARLFSWVDLTLGARLSHSRAEDETTEREGQRAQRLTKTILSPSAALSVPLGGQGIAYLRYARAMRPGGLAPAGLSDAGRFDADELDSVDLGFRRASGGGRLTLTGSVYHTLWKDIQSDYLLANGLVSTRNAGRGRIWGIEAGAEWAMGAGFTLTGGGSYQNALLTRATGGIRLDDRHLPIAPTASGRLALLKRFDLGDWNGQAALQANYIGRSRLSFDDDLDRQMGNYGVVAANSEFTREGWTLGARIDNLFDVKGDSFAFGNAFSIRAGSQYTPLRPRTLTLSVGRHW